MSALEDIRIIFCDVDITLLPYCGKDLMPTRRLIEELIDRGYIFVPCSGRSIKSIPKEILQAKGVRYVISSNGSRVYDLEKQENIFVRLIPAEPAYKCTEIALEHGITASAYYNGERLLDTTYPLPDLSMSPITREWDATAKRVDLLAFFKEANNPECIVLFSYDVVTKANCIAAIKKAGLFEQLAYTSSGFETVEITNREAGKETAMRWLCEHLGMDLKTVLAAGDNYNDMGMLTAAAIAIVPANAVPEVLTMEKVIVVPSAEDSGVEKFLQKLIEN